MDEGVCYVGNWWSRFNEGSRNVTFADAGITIRGVRSGRIVTGYNHRSGVEVAGYCPCAHCYDLRTEQRRREAKQARDWRRCVDRDWYDIGQ
jgi:hypothetical protein